MDSDESSFMIRLKGYSKDDETAVSFVGVGSAFAKRNAQTSMVIAKNGTTVLVDCGTTIPTALAKLGVNIWDFDYYHPTHSHADHVGGYEELLLMSRYVAKKKPKLIITEAYFKTLWDDTLRGGCEHNEDGLLKFSDLVEPVMPKWRASEPREMYDVSIPTSGAPIELTIFRTGHIPGFVDGWERAFWSTGVVVDGKVMYSGDTRFDENLFTDVCDPHGLKGIFHDCQLSSPGVVHASYDELKTLPDWLREKTFLVHYGDNFDKFDPQADGFKGFAKADGMIYLFGGKE